MVGKPKSAEMNPGLGFRIRCDIERPDPAVVKGLGEFETPVISDLMNRLYTMVPAIRSMTDQPLKLLGPACTVKVFPGDNLMVHKSLDVARPGDVVVVDTSGSSLTAMLGDLISTKARHRRLGGFVVDGLVRDIDAIRRLDDLPVFARGITPIGPLHRGPGEVNYPIAAGGIVVHPGDIIIGDANGVVVVPREEAAQVLQRLRDKSEVEAAYAAAVAVGDFSNSWVDAILNENGISLNGRASGVSRPGNVKSHPLVRIFKLPLCTLQACAVIARARPDAVLSTGPGVAVPVCIIAKLAGSRVIHVESYSRVRTLSLTGSFMRRIADLFFVQWEDLLPKVPEAVFAGRLY